MRRLLRWSFNLSALASAVLFVGVCAVWVGSYFRQGRLYAERVARYAVGADRGTFWVEAERGYTSRFDGRTWTDTIAPYADHWQFGADADDVGWQEDPLFLSGKRWHGVNSRHLPCTCGNVKCLELTPIFARVLS